MPESIQRPETPNDMNVERNLFSLRCDLHDTITERNTLPLRSVNGVIRFYAANSSQHSNHSEFLGNM